MDSELKQERCVEPEDNTPLLADIDSDDQIYTLKKSFKDGKRETIEDEISLEQLQQLKTMRNVSALLTPAYCKRTRASINKFTFHLDAHV